MCSPENEHTDIRVKGELLEYVSEFNYLGSIISMKTKLTPRYKIESRATRAFWKFKDQVFYNHDFNSKTKLSYYPQCFMVAKLGSPIKDTSNL